jgi:hypothetical protein
MAGNGVHTIAAGDQGWANEVDGKQIGGTYPLRPRRFT